MKTEKSEHSKFLPV